MGMVNNILNKLKEVITLEFNNFKERLKVLEYYRQDKALHLHY